MQGNPGGGPAFGAIDSDPTTIVMVPIWYYTIINTGAIIAQGLRPEFGKRLMMGSFNPLMSDTDLRVGGSATVWGTAGLTQYRPELTAAPKIQSGAFTLSFGGGAVTTTGTVTFPNAFATAPIVFGLTVQELTLVDRFHVFGTAGTLTATQMGLRAYRAVAGAAEDITIHWTAIGPY